ncbi:MAG TPA: hypothetical protein DCQ94_09575 [Nitrospira sp.]|nr:hypothetical protein [Nitrospira sp.]
MSCASRSITAGIMALLAALAGCAVNPGRSDPPVAGQSVCHEPKTERSYFEPCVTSTTRQSDTPIKDLPGSAQVINRDLLDDQRALTLGDALRNVSGVQGGGGRR